MKRKLITVVLSAAVITGMTLSGCGNPAPAESPAEAQYDTPGFRCYIRRRGSG